MSSEEIEIQLWEYIDGTCGEADRQRIAALIAVNPTWKKQYEEIVALQAGISSSLELEQPSMRFTKDVMEVIAKTNIAPATKQYINKTVIRGIAAFFIVTITVLLGYALVTTNYTSAPSSSKLNLDWLSGIFTSTTFNTVIGINIILGLLLADTLLRKRKKTESA